MFVFFALFATFASIDCASVPAIASSTSVPVAILSNTVNLTAEGNYNWSFELADGTKAEQVASVKTVDEEKVEDIKGSYSYVDPDGNTHSVQYIANEHGFFPKGDDIHPEIASHLVELEANPPRLSSKISV
ncbi:unnamed protein product [Ceutorhynchus assimilis]|uniref:Uncharacterized protein n=1 Tax=Ceutorhynchus assimilis TaxID=467358 RepID=A0A9N9MRX1_9CUCU|nr:unnamed protein product [Ceutorhynchus assimilis]